MSLSEIVMEMPAEHAKNVFGQFDFFAKKIVQILNITIVARDSERKILGAHAATNKARNIFEQLIELSKRGNIINEQNVEYASSLSFEENEAAIVEIDKDLICHTINGKPIKPKTLGQESEEHER